ncbi:high affinity cationic amino acid transporter 1-like [Clavelina lepadiformis]|uniref:high affinity cationic amino acid transporter 1-like n=1 Tax=Clavelina lepadiformis TaxID=159417 RepID=UPI004043356E
MPALNRVLRHLMRKKTFLDAAKESLQTELARCLTTTDLVALGVGSTLGAGVYVLTGSVARDKTGPAIVLSFFVAAVASVMAGLCYAEFGARVPKAGSAYVYSYVTVGEIWAFIIGWNLILEYVIGTSSVARAWSENVDALLGGKFRKFSLTYLKMDLPGFAEYPDFFAFAVILVLTGVLCFGVKESALFSKVFTMVNICVILFVIIAGSIVADPQNWRRSTEDIRLHIANRCVLSKDTRTTSSPNVSTTVTELDCSLYQNGTYEKHKRFGDGGFLPYGFSGVASGAATCFFGFVGFDIIATTGEEVKNPQKAIPVSIVISLLIVFFAYVGISVVLTLMVPYYMMDVGAPLPNAFSLVQWNWAVIPLAIGATCALSSSLLGGLFPMPRIVYAMAQDGLIFRFLARINKKFKTPLIATILSGLLAAIMVLLFDLEDLVDMMSIGTLLAYTLVAICVLILRYQPDVPTANKADDDTFMNRQYGQDQSLVSRCFNPSNNLPTKQSGNISYCCIVVIGGLSFILCGILVHFSEIPYIPAVTAIAIVAFVILCATIIIMRQPQSQTKLSFSVPLVPILPILSVICNVYLMCELSFGTWIRFAVWMAIGLSIYIFYGYKQSSEGRRFDSGNRNQEMLAPLAQDEHQRTAKAQL